MNIESILLDMKDVQKYLNLSRTTIYGLVKAGKLKAERLNPKGKLYFQRSDIENFKC